MKTERDGPAASLPRSATADESFICVGFSDVGTVRLWEPIMEHLLGSFGLFQSRRTWELEEAAYFLEAIATAASNPTGYSGCFLEIESPGNWATELKGKYGIVAVLRDTARKGGVALRASEAKVVRKWLTAVLHAVRKKIAPPPRPQQTLPETLQLFMVLLGLAAKPASVVRQPPPAHQRLPLDGAVLM